MRRQATNNRPEHAMLSAFASGLPVRLGSVTNTQGTLVSSFLYLLRRTHARMPVIAFRLWRRR
jgi:hypothetical protein